MLQSALISRRERGSLRGKVKLLSFGGSVELRALAVLHRKFVVKVDGLDLLGNHLDLVMVTPFTANREPFLDLHAIAALLLFLKRTLEHQVVPATAHQHHLLLLIVAIYHLICRKHGLVLRQSTTTIYSLLGSIIPVISLANWWLLS